MKNSLGNLLLGLFSVLPIFLPMLLSPVAHANDTSPGVMLPGLRSDPPGTVTASAASIVFRSGQIELALTVSVRREQGGSVTIQMPRFGWLGESEPYPERHFPELQILTDGVAAMIDSKFAAFVGPADVTEAIRKSGVDPFVISGTPPFVTPGTGGTRALEELKRLGAVEKSDAYYLARWTAQRTVKVALAPGSHTLELKYMGRPGFDLLRFDQIVRPAYLARYCLSSADLLRAFGQVPANRGFVVSEYAIPLSIDGKSVSASVAFAASNKKQSTRALLAFCGVDGMAVIGETAGSKRPALPDANGIVRILSVVPADAP